MLDRSRTKVDAPRGDGPAPEITAFDDENAEAKGVAPGVATGPRAGRHVVGHGRALPHQRAVGAVRDRAAGRGRAGARAGRRRVRAAARGARRRSTSCGGWSSIAPGRTLSDLLADLAAGEPLGGEERREHLDAILSLGKEYLAADGGGGSVGGFVAWLEMSMRGDDDLVAGAGSDAVQLVSFHRAKGLEWELVCVTGVERGLVPISYANDDPDALDEERRLLHVALSRAGQFLHVTWSQQRTVGGRSARRSPSPWLAAIEAANPGRSVPANPGNRLATVRADLRLAAARRPPRARRRPVPGAQGLAPRPRTRRGVPAYVVFRDATLVALASERPTSHSGLLDVSGIGPTKAELYGDDVLQLVARHAPDLDLVAEHAADADADAG